jgi:hypothetical protein
MAGGLTRRQVGRNPNGTAAWHRKNLRDHVNLLASWRNQWSKRVVSGAAKGA